jgi:hypothetical protein
VAVISSSALTPLPMLPVVLHLLVHIYSLGMVRANDSLCATPLMTDPLTVQRVHTFHSGMHILALLLPGRVLCWQSQAVLSLVLASAGPAPLLLLLLLPLLRLLLRLLLLCFDLLPLLHLEVLCG